MIKIVVYRFQNGIINGFKVSGHAGYEERGRDIVCSAVSAVAQTALLGILEVAKVDAHYEVKDGFLSCRLPAIQAEKTQVMCTSILETMLVGIANIKDSYGKHVDIVEEEV